MSELATVLKKSGLKLVKRSDYHFQVTGGMFLVNYYPTKQTAYINGMTQGQRRITPEELVAFALGKTVPGGVKIQGRKNLKGACNRLYKKSTVCAICNKHVERSQASVDHRIPISRGGSNRADNLQLVHQECNFKKGASL